MLLLPPPAPASVAAARPAAVAPDKVVGLTLLLVLLWFVAAASGTAVEPKVPKPENEAGEWEPLLLLLLLPALLRLPGVLCCDLRD